MELKKGKYFIIRIGVDGKLTIYNFNSNSVKIAGRYLLLQGWSYVSLAATGGEIKLLNSEIKKFKNHISALSYSWNDKKWYNLLFFEDKEIAKNKYKELYEPIKDSYDFEFNKELEDFENSSNKA